MHNYDKEMNFKHCCLFVLWTILVIDNISCRYPSIKCSLIDIYLGIHLITRTPNSHPFTDINTLSFISFTYNVCELMLPLSDDDTSPDPTAFNSLFESCVCHAARALNSDISSSTARRSAISGGMCARRGRREKRLIIIMSRYISYVI